MARFLFRAQRHNMTNGDFAFFTYQPLQSALARQSWKFYVDNPDDEARLRRALHVVKQVLEYLPFVYMREVQDNAAIRYSVNNQRNRLLFYIRNEFCIF